MMEVGQTMLRWESAKFYCNLRHLTFRASESGGQKIYPNRWCDIGDINQFSYWDDLLRLEKCLFDRLRNVVSQSCNLQVVSLMLWFGTHEGKDWGSDTCLEGYFNGSKVISKWRFCLLDQCQLDEAAPWSRNYPWVWSWSLRSCDSLTPTFPVHACQLALSLYLGTDCILKKASTYEQLGV